MKVSIFLLFQMSTVAITCATGAATSQETVCDFIALHFDRPIKEYARDFGPIVSSEKVREGIGDDGKWEMMSVRLAQGVSVTYVTSAAQPDLILEVMMEGNEVLSKAGLNVNASEDVRKLLGPAAAVQGNVMLYGCGEPNAELEIDPIRSFLSLVQHISTN